MKIKKLPIYLIILGLLGLGCNRSPFPKELPKNYRNIPGKHVIDGDKDRNKDLEVLIFHYRKYKEDKPDKTYSYLEFRFDPDGNIISDQYIPAGGLIVFSHNLNKNILTQPANSEKIDKKTYKTEGEYFFDTNKDGKNDLRIWVKPYFNGAKSVFKYFYDNKGNLEKVVHSIDNKLICEIIEFGFDTHNKTSIKSIIKSVPNEKDNTQEILSDMNADGRWEKVEKYVKWKR